MPTNGDSVHVQPDDRRGYAGRAHASTVWAITSGKGGVGKSIVAVNLAEALAASGVTVALLDVDFGQSACPVLMNESPGATVADVVQQTAMIDDAAHRTAGGVTLVVGAAEAGQIDGLHVALYDMLDEVLGQLRRTHQVILIDTPAGVEGPVRWALDRADEAILVLVDEPTAVADTYQLAKLVWQLDPAYPLGAVVNFADTEANAEDVANRFGAVTRHFLNRKAAYLGWIPFAASVRKSVSVQEPVFRTPGAEREAFERLAEVLAASPDRSSSVVQKSNE